MIYRIILYLFGLFLTSLGLTLIIIYLSYNNVGFNLLENVIFIIKTPAIYIFVIGCILSLKILLYDLIKKSK